ncbi:MAG: GGDEF domain-containing protein, partial [Candidatus Fermentibacteraceae bacterium]|nr:GGDEF domain-containing protein [Candidatus Fermentibacteraceae bacterium]
QAESLSKELGDKGMLGDVLRGRAAVLEMAGDHLGAYKTLCVYLEIQQEQMSEKRVRQIDALRLYYETEERERKIEQLNLTNRNLVRAYSRVEEQMRTDALTGLANRRAALEWLSSQQEHFKVTGIGFGLILADIDGFKYCNDLLGHECGDAILIQLANRLHRTLRKRDLSVRWGGEEFLILLPETSLEEAAHVAETVRACIEAEPFTANRTDIPITMTFGVSQGGELPNDAVIRLADQAMYRGKRLGKNRVEVAAALIEP